MGRRVLLDVDLAALYQVSTRALVQATKRNPSRFPPDVMFQLTLRESAHLRSQNVISSDSPSAAAAGVACAHRVSRRDVVEDGRRRGYDAARN
jgi:hypothetical protein